MYIIGMKRLIVVKMQQGRHKRQAAKHQRWLLTLSFEFPYNYSQKCVLRRNMTPPDRHGSPLRRMIFLKMRISGWPSECEPVLRQVPAGDNQSQRGSPVSLSPLSHPRKKISPSAPLFLFVCCFSFLPRTPLVSLILTPRPPWLSASQTLPRAARRREAERKGVGRPQFHQHFTVPLQKRCARERAGVCVCMRAYCCERKSDGLRGQWLRGATPTLRRGEKPHTGA